MIWYFLMERSTGFEPEEEILDGLIVEVFEFSREGENFWMCSEVGKVEVGSSWVGSLNGLVTVSTSSKEGDNAIDS